MTRIITAGDSLLRSELRLTCTLCSTVFGEDDAKKIHAKEQRETHEEGVPKPSLWTLCPLCGKRVNITDSEMVDIAVEKQNYFKWDTGGYSRH